MKYQEFDDEMKNDLMGSFEDAFCEIEHGLVALEHDPGQSIVNNLFRAIHSIKGNAGMVQLEGIVDYTHHIESVFSRLREETLSFTSALSEAVGIGMDRLRDLHHRDILGVHFEHLETDVLALQFSDLSRADESRAGQIIDSIRGLDHETKVDETSATNTSKIELTAKQEEDLAFFQALSLQLDQQCKHWDGRSIQVFTWAQKLNEYGGNPVSYQQLAAACYIHDFGMSLLPQELLDQTKTFNEDDIQELRKHTSWGYRLLTQIGGWEEAATIVDQHHEFDNGQGYPRGLRNDQIHPGAKIIAIIDAFFSMVNGRPDRSVRRTALRAVSEINARKHTQFSAEWVDWFNLLLKDEIRAGHI